MALKNTSKKYHLHNLNNDAERVSASAGRSAMHVLWETGRHTFPIPQNPPPMDEQIQMILSN